MQELRTNVQEGLEDVYFGQVAISWARWFIIAAGIILVLWSSPDPYRLVVGIIPVVGLMVVNFYLHGRYLAGRPANRAMIAATSLLDLALITGVVVLWLGQGGLASEFYIMYYPVVLAFAFVMPPRITLAYTLAALGSYAVACIVVDPFLVGDIDQVKTLVMRLITLGSMGALGTYFWRIQRNRRRAGTATPVTES